MISNSVAIVVLAAAVIGLQIVRERTFPSADAPQQVLYVTSPAALGRLALSFDAIVADLYWIRTIQYYGSTRLSTKADKNYDLLYPLLDFTTSLDPDFSVPYRFGAFFLSEERPGGAGRGDLAIRLLEKAIAAHPDRWEYPHDVAFVHYRNRDYRTAARWFERAADTPGAPDWLRPLVGAMLTTGGDTMSARLVWRSLLNSEVEFMRRDAARRLQQLDAIDTIALLKRATGAYTARTGRRPSSWQDMIRAGMLRGVPLDPVGTAYLLDPASGDVTLDPRSSLSPLTMEQPS